LMGRDLTTIRPDAVLYSTGVSFLEYCEGEHETGTWMGILWYSEHTTVPLQFPTASADTPLPFSAAEQHKG